MLDTLCDMVDNEEKEPMVPITQEEEPAETVHGADSQWRTAELTKKKSQAIAALGVDIT